MVVAFGLVPWISVVTARESLSSALYGVLSAAPSFYGGSFMQCVERCSVAF